MKQKNRKNLSITNSYAKKWLINIINHFLPNNRKIKFYENFSDFYRTKNKDINYKIIQEPIGDGQCLIEEIEKVIEPIQNIEQKQEVIKTSEDIIREKDAEIEKLKKEIQELKKFYINS